MKIKLYFTFAGIISILEYIMTCGIKPAIKLTPTLIDVYGFLFIPLIASSLLLLTGKQYFKNENNQSFWIYYCISLWVLVFSSGITDIVRPEYIDSHDYVSCLIILAVSFPMALLWRFLDLKRRKKE